MSALKKPFRDGVDAATDASSERESLLEDFWREQGAAFLHIIVENLLQLVGCCRVEDEGVHFVVETERACIEVRGANSAEKAVYHHDFAMMEPVVVVKDLSTSLHQLAHFEADYIVVYLSVASCGDHELHSDTSFQSPSQRGSHFSEKHCIRVHNLHQMLCIVDGDAVSLSHDFGRFLRPTRSKGDGSFPAPHLGERFLLVIAMGWL